MPRVASQAHSVLPPHSRLPNARSHSDADAKPSASPFSEMLDGATPPADPAPRQGRTERPQRADRADKPHSAEPKSAESKSAEPKSAKPASLEPNSTADRSTDAKPAKDSTGVKEKVPVQLEALGDEIIEWNERSIADAIRRQARHEDTARWDTIDFKLD